MIDDLFILNIIFSLMWVEVYSVLNCPGQILHACKYVSEKKHAIFVRVFSQLYS